jgi:hypothetical protein
MKAESVVRKPLALVEPPFGPDDYPIPEFASPELNAAALGLRAGLMAVQHACEQTLVDPQSDGLQEFFLQMRDRCLQTIGHLRAEACSLAEGEGKELIRRLREDRIGLSCWLQREVERLVEYDKTGTIGEAFSATIERVERLAAEAEPTIRVVQEPERLISVPGDPFFVRSVKRLKRWRRNVRGLFGARSELTRKVPFRRLVRYHVAGAPEQQEPLSPDRRALRKRHRDGRSWRLESTVVPRAVRGNGAASPDGAGEVGRGG